MKIRTGIATLLLISTPAFAQVAQLKAPDPSPAASVVQTVGITEMKITYHRPGVNGRKIWGGLVPYGDVWRAGANENTTITFSTPVKVGGKALAAGTYGLHMLPTQKDWTIIFSKMAVAWGSFSYDQKEDALRVAVTPQTAEGATERLLFSFDDPTEKDVTVALRWEKLKVPVKIEVDTPQLVMASMRAELRGLPKFFWQGWNQAARYWVNHSGNLDEAVKLAEQSQKIQQTFANTMTRAMILEKKGDKKAAGELRSKALAMANENEMNQYGYELLLQKKIEDAIGIFEKNVQAHPESWNVHDSLGEALRAKGDKKGAYDSYAKALSMVKDPAQKKRIEHTLSEIKAN